MSTVDDQTDNLIVTLTSRAAVRVVPRGDDESAALEGTTTGYWAELPRAPRSELIYTDRRDMPSLEQLLAEHAIASAVFEREAHPTPARAAIAGALAAAVTATGTALFVMSLVASSEPNAFVGLFLMLAGWVLIATVVLAVRRPA